jgi:SAM-dependent methyltransferase
MTGTNGPADVWASGDDYDSYVGRWSQLVTRDFLTWLAVAPGSHWLDVGCGTGALSLGILETQAPLAVHGIDSSAGYIAYVQTQIQDKRATFAVGDAQALPTSDATYDAAVSGLVLNFLPDPGLAVQEMARVTQTGGTVAAYVWDYAGEMQMMRHFWDVAVALDPAVRDLDEGRRFPLCKPEALESVFRTAGLANVTTRAIDVPTNFRSFDDYWSPFLGGQGPAPSYTMSLDEERKTALRDRIRSSLPIAADGSIHLIARTWAARGIR